MISDIYKEFMLEQKFRNNTVKTIAWYQDNLEKFFLWLNTDNAANLSLENFKQYGVYLHDNVTKHNGDKLSDSSVQGNLRAVKAFYNYAIEQQYIDDFSRKLKLPKVHHREQKILDDEEIETLFGCFGNSEIDTRNKCFIAYMLDCGLRRGELTKINIGDVDIKNKTTIIKGKGGKQRLVPMGAMSSSLLSEYINRYRNCACLTSPLFIGNNGERCSDNLIKQLFKRLKDRSGIKRLHPHLLRHTFATYYIADGGDLETLRLILGHANIQTTQRYLHMAFNLKLQRSRHTSHIDKLYRM